MTTGVLLGSRYEIAQLRGSRVLEPRLEPCIWSKGPGSERAIVEDDWGRGSNASCLRYSYLYGLLWNGVRCGKEDTCDIICFVNCSEESCAIRTKVNALDLKGNR